MAVLGGESDIGGGRKQLLVAAVFFVAGIVVGTLGEATEQRIAGFIRGSVLRPFIATQELVASARTRAADVDQLMMRIDSLTAILSAQSTLVEENETLRRILDLSERLEPRFRSATVLRPGTPGSESMFLLDVGRSAGILVGAPIISPDGLVGVVRDVGESSAVGMDWTHPDFRASAMVRDTDTYGIVENLRGAFREADRLVLTGTAYNEVIEDGTDVVTSGLGGVYPRGVPIGTIEGVAGYEGSWRKSYWLRPSVLPAEVTHVLIPVEDVSEEGITWPEDGDPLSFPMPFSEDGGEGDAPGSTEDGG